MSNRKRAGITTLPFTAIKFIDKSARKRVQDFLVQGGYVQNLQDVKLHVKGSYIHADINKKKGQKGNLIEDSIRVKDIPHRVKINYI